MNLSRFAIAFLMVVPTVLFIAAAESAPDPASASKQPAAEPPATVSKSASAANGDAAPAPPLRTPTQSMPLPGSQDADAATNAAIVAAIRADPGMAGADVSVNTENGVATLTGLVRSREQAALASAYANRQLGVIRVDNALTIPAQ